LTSEIEKKKRNLDEAFVYTYNYSWIRDKLIMHELTLNCFDDFLKLLYDKTDFKFRDDQREGYFLMTKIDSIASVVKYSEDLAAISIGFGKGHFKINETLRKYKVKEIKDFFQQVASADYDYIRKILGYPGLSAVELERKESMLQSVEQAKQYFGQIRNFYEKNMDLYNCYKHGLRIMPTCDEDKQWMLLKFPSLKNGEFDLEGFEKKEVDENHEEALKIVGLIVTLMEVIFRKHRSLYFNRGKKFECLVVAPNK